MGGRASVGADRRPGVGPRAVEGRAPIAGSGTLDPVVPDRPTVLYHASGHAALLNSAALRASGVLRAGSVRRTQRSSADPRTERRTVSSTRRRSACWFDSPRIGVPVDAEGLARTLAGARRARHHGRRGDEREPPRGSVRSCGTLDASGRLALTVRAYVRLSGSRVLGARPGRGLAAAVGGRGEGVPRRCLRAADRGSPKAVLGRPLELGNPPSGTKRSSPTARRGRAGADWPPRSTRSATTRWRGPHGCSGHGRDVDRTSGANRARVADAARRLSPLSRPVRRSSSQPGFVWSDPGSRTASGREVPLGLRVPDADHRGIVVAGRAMHRSTRSTRGGGCGPPWTVATLPAARRTRTPGEALSPEEALELYTSGAAAARSACRPTDISRRGLGGLRRAHDPRPPPGFARARGAPPVRETWVAGREVYTGERGPVGQQGPKSRRSCSSRPCPTPRISP